MTQKKKLPVGTDNFEKIIMHNLYYIDKTELIAELLNGWGEVNLFTRPRRFGKSLNMSMLKTFFEIGCDPELFKELKISQNTEFCNQYMGKFPVISITLKSAEGQNFEAVRKSLKDIVGTEARRFSFLLQSEKLTDQDKNSYRALISTEDTGDFQMSDTALEKSLLRLTELQKKSC